LTGQIAKKTVLSGQKPDTWQPYRRLTCIRQRVPLLVVMQQCLSIGSVLMASTNRVIHLSALAVNR